MIYSHFGCLSWLLFLNRKIIIIVYETMFRDFWHEWCPLTELRRSIGSMHGN
jgi:hypothetical protein